MGATAAPHLPQQAPIDGYGKGGFRFARMSHRGSLLCLPSGIWAWEVTRPEEIDETTLAPVFEAAAGIDLFLLGAGRDPWAITPSLREHFRSLAISVEVSSTGSAVSTYNLLLGEGRLVGAGLIAVE
jgi:uncharacterized protein